MISVNQYVPPLRTCFTRVILLAVLAGYPSDLWSRMPIPQYEIDLTLTEFSRAPVIFRGRVDATTPAPQGARENTIARFQVDRWYRSGGVPDAVVYFAAYNSESAINGHSCIDFRPDSHWLVFATEVEGHLELVHDCNGAVAVSRRIGPTMAGDDYAAQMEADFIAGLADPDSTARILSIQRLGGLRLASSRPVLRQVHARGSSTEAQWAAYALLRTGDTSILPFVRDLFIRDTSEVPLIFIALELRTLKNKSATPGLIQIADTAPQAFARETALSALAEKIHALESVPTMAAHLGDTDHRVRFYSLVGMGVLTHEPACTLPTEPMWTDDMVEPQIQKCQAWWENVGKLQFSGR